LPANSAPFPKKALTSSSSLFFFPSMVSLL
jgi:hypothetical protein